MDVSDGRGRYHSFSGIDTDKTVMDNFEAPFLGLDQLNRLDFDFGSYCLKVFLCLFWCVIFRVKACVRFLI